MVCQTPSSYPFGDTRKLQAGSSASHDSMALLETPCWVLCRTPFPSSAQLDQVTSDCCAARCIAPPPPTTPWASSLLREPPLPATRNPTSRTAAPQPAAALTAAPHRPWEGVVWITGATLLTIPTRRLHRGRGESPSARWRQGCHSLVHFCGRSSGSSPRPPQDERIRAHRELVQVDAFKEGRERGGRERGASMYKDMFLRGPDANCWHIPEASAAERDIVKAAGSPGILSPKQTAPLSPLKP